MYIQDFLRFLASSMVLFSRNANSSWGKCSCSAKSMAMEVKRCSLNANGSIVLDEKHFVAWNTDLVPIKRLHNIERLWIVSDFTYDELGDKSNLALPSSSSFDPIECIISVNQLIYMLLTYLLSLISVPCTRIEIEKRK